jgi:hypothetical protein
MLKSNWEREMDEQFLVFACRKCSKHIRRSRQKIGTLVACAQCGTTNRTPGTAGQVTVEPAELEQMRMACIGHGRALLIWAIAEFCFLVSLIPLVKASVDSPSIANWISLAVFLGMLCATFQLLLATGRTFPYLGRTKLGSTLLFFMFLPGWLLLSISSYFSLSRHVRRLTKATQTNL